MYQSGILTNATECGTYIDHAVTVVGYSSLDEPIPYWIVRNSWGEAWGDAGYVNIAMTDGSGVCGINMGATYPNMLMQPTPITFWFIVGSMSVAVFLVVPISISQLNKSIAIGEHPGHKPFKKTLVFEAISFTLCLTFYSLSMLTDFTNF